MGLSICGLATGACHRPVLNVTFGPLNSYAPLSVPVLATVLSTKGGPMWSSSADDTVRALLPIKIAISSRLVVPDWRGSQKLSELMGGCCFWVVGTLLGQAPIPLLLGLIK